MSTSPNIDCGGDSWILPLLQSATFAPHYHGQQCQCPSRPLCSRRLHSGSREGRARSGQHLAAGFPALCKYPFRLVLRRTATSNAPLPTFASLKLGQHAISSSYHRKSPPRQSYLQHRHSGRRWVSQSKCCGTTLNYYLV